MEFSTLIDIITNNGVSIAVLLYFMYLNSKYYDVTSKALSKIEVYMDNLNNILKIKKQKE